MPLLAMDDLSAAEWAQMVNRRNLRMAWSIMIAATNSQEAWTAEQREQLYAAAFQEWGMDWIRLIQEKGSGFDR